MKSERRVAIQGIRGSFHEEAARSRFGYRIRTVECLTFRQVANEVGSLARALATFEHHELNLLRLRSIPILGRPAEQSMHVDVEWQRRRNYDAALTAIKPKIPGLRILGEYRRTAMRFR